LSFSIEISGFSIKIITFSIEILSISIKILSFSIEILSFSIEILVFSIEILVFSIVFPDFFSVSALFLEGLIGDKNSECHPLLRLRISEKRNYSIASLLF
jgi:hypothetical protein